MSCGIALARAAGQPVVVYWQKNRHLNCSFESLFEPIDGVRVVSVETSRLRIPFSLASLRYHLKTAREPIDLFLGNEEIKAHMAAGTDLVSLVAGAQHCVIITYYRYFKAGPLGDDFRPRKDILAAVERAAGELDPGALIGVHIRGTDNAEALELSPVESFLKRLDDEVERDPEARFFLATEDPGVEQVVKQEFPGRVLTLPKVYARERARGVRDALVDLLVLSKCPLILGSRWSSFTETAAELGTAQVELVGADART